RRGLVRLGRQVVAAQVGRDDPEARRRQRRDLQPPAVPEIGEAVQQDDERPVPGLDVVQLDVVVALAEPGVRGQAGGRLVGRAHDDLLSDRKLARISSQKSRGCSQAAKWPPRSSWLKWTRLSG